MQKTLDKGGKIIFGSLDYKVEGQELASGNFFHPLVIEDIPEDTPCRKEELFGPVFSLFKVKTEEDAI